MPNSGFSNGLEVQFSSEREVDHDATERFKIDQLLLCTDFSPASESAVEAAIGVWRRTKAHITVLHVCEFGPMPATTEDGLDYINSLYAERRHALEAVAARLLEVGIRADTVMLDGNAPTMILEQIAWLRAGTWL